MKHVMIATEGLTKEYGGRPVVADLNLNVGEGEIYGFLGPNGAGKTTTLLMLLGLVTPTRGKIRLFGKELSEDYYGIKKRIGVVAEIQHFYGEMTCLEYLEFFGRLYDVKQPQVKAKDLLSRLDLVEKTRALTRSLSRGMEQKLALARALMHEPDLLMLDEPGSSLDPYGMVELRDAILAEKASGKTVIVSSHILSEVERTADRVGIIADGRLVAEDTMANLKSRLRSNVEIDVEVEGPREAIRAAITGLKDVLSVVPVGEDAAGAAHAEGEGAPPPASTSRLTVTCRQGTDVRAAISRAIQIAGGVVLSMKTKEMSLEEAFITITEKEVPFLARGVERT